MEECNRLKWKIGRLNATIANLQRENEKLKRDLRIKRAKAWQSNTYSTPMPHKRSTER